MDREARAQVKKCLSQPARKRWDVPINIGAMIVPMEFIELTGHVTSSHEEKVLETGSSQYRIIKQISRFGDIKLFDYYESEIYDKELIDSFGLPVGEFSQQLNHNIKVNHNGKTSHFVGMCRHIEILDVKHCGGKYFFVKIKTCYNEKDWVRL